MSVAAAISGGTKDGQLAKRRRFKIVKVAIASSGVLLLLYVGFQGRQHARLRARLDDILVIRDQLQQKLEEARSIEPAIDGVRGTNAIASRALSPSLKVHAFVSALRTRLEQFDSEYGSGKLPEAESLELRLSKATLANAEQRYADALATLSDGDEMRKQAGAAAQIGRWTDVLEIRGDSFFGLHQWRDALERYQQILSLQTNRIAAVARVAECQSELGGRNGALAR